MLIQRVAECIRLNRSSCTLTMDKLPHRLLGGLGRLADSLLPSAWLSAFRREPVLIPLLLLNVAAVLVRMNNAVRYPSLHGFDAFGHVTYIWHLLFTHSVPLPSDGWGRFHPPLFYALSAAIWSLLRSLEPGQVLKIINVIFGLAAMGCAVVSFLAVRTTLSGRLWPAWSAALFVLLLPVSIYIAPMLGNEPLNMLLCSVALLLLIRAISTQRTSVVVALGVTLGLAMLCKFTSIVILGAVGATILLWGIFQGGWRATLKMLCIVGALVLAISGWFYGRNAVLYGNPFQMSRDFFATQRIEATIPTGARGLAAYTSFDTGIFSDPTYFRGSVIDSVWTGAYATTWSDAHVGWFLPPPFGSLALRRIGRALMVLGLLPTFLVIVGLVRGVRRLATKGWDPTLASMLTALVMMLAMFVIYTFANRIYTAVKASYLLPAIVPFSFWFALGLEALVTRSRAVLLIVSGWLVTLSLLILPVFTYQLFFEVDLGPQFWNSLGVIDYWAGFRDSARTKFDAAIEYGPPYMPASNLYLGHENLSTMAFDEGRYSESLVELKRAIELVRNQVPGRPDDVAQFLSTVEAEYSNSLAVIYERLGWDDSAYDAVERSLRSDSSIPEAHYDQGLLLLKRGQPEAAITSLQRAIDLDPGFVDAHLLMGVAQQRAGNCAEALSILQKAMSERNWPRRTYPHEAGTGEFHDAAITRRRHISHTPPGMNADYALAVCQASAGQPEKAAEVLSRGLREGRFAAGDLRDRQWRDVAAGALVPKVLPNIILVVIDTLRADHLSAYGYPRPTSPKLDALASSGVRFDRAYSVSSWTAPAVGSMLTGLNPSRHGLVDSQSRLSDGIRTLAEELGDLGYETAAFSANFVHVSPRTALDRGFSRFDVLSRATEGEEFTFAIRGAHFRGYDAREVTEAVQSWIHAGPRAPFFLYVHYLDPHAGYQPPAELATFFAPQPYTGKQGAAAEDIGKLVREHSHLPAEDLQHLIALYDAEIRFTDQQIGVLLDSIDGTGLRDNSVVVVTADHGEEFADHGGFFHGFTLYDEMLHVPLIVAARGTWRFAPVVDSRLAQLTDIFPTLVELAGGVPRSDLDGRRLIPLPAGHEAAPRAFAIAQLEPDPVLDAGVQPKRHSRAVIGNTRTLLVGMNGGNELYRTSEDPHEQLEVSAEEPANVERLLQAVREGRTGVHDADAAPDETQRERLRSLGYVP